MKLLQGICLTLLLFSTAALAQTETELREYFEGKTVIVKIDMPATHQGVDIYPERPKLLDFESYSRRLKSFGTSLRSGDSALVTKVRVKDRNIEFQLGGGGYGTAGDDTNTDVSFSPAPKSRYEKELEDRLKSETDSQKRRQLQDDLNRERRQREREDSRNRTAAIEASEAKKQRIAQRRAEGGSRFNIWFAGKVPPTTPAALSEILSEYLAFADRGRINDDRTNTGGFRGIAPEALLRLRKGLSKSDVENLLGRPQRTNEKGDAQNRILVWLYQVEDRDVQIEFFADVLVRYVISSR